MVFEDRISKYPGRWTMVREDGSSVVVTLVRNDEPIKPGTPINAETLNELSTVAGAINAKEEAISAAQSAASESVKSKESASNAAVSEKNSKASEENSKKLLQATKEYFEQVRTITIGAQGWYATPEALQSAVPVGENGWWAVVGTTDTIWTWDGDTNSWKDSIQKVDLSDYYTKNEADAKFGNFYTKPEVDTLLKGVNPYPVGSIYQSTDATSPAELFGGTWEQIASNRVLMGASSTHAAGTTVGAGLPNITGTVGGTYFNTAIIGGDDPNSGAFKYKSVYSRSLSGDNSSMEFRNVNFSASNSNAIYGRSSTVQPAAYYVHIWRRIA